MSWMLTIRPSAPMNAIESGTSVSFIQNGPSVSVGKTKSIPASAGTLGRCISPRARWGSVAATSIVTATGVPLAGLIRTTFAAGFAATDATGTGEGTVVNAEAAVNVGGTLVGGEAATAAAAAAMGVGADVGVGGVAGAVGVTTPPQATNSANAAAASALCVMSRA